MPSMNWNDIIKCQNGCAKQETCLRWKLEPAQWQSWSDFKPNEDGSCDYFREIKKGKDFNPSPK